MIQTIGPYRVEREIGRGGMGVVYLARDERLDRDVAIKCLPEELASDPGRLDRFEREAKTLAQLNHSNIAAIYGVEEQDGQKYLILEYVEGETLIEFLNRNRHSWKNCLIAAADLAEGLAAAHAKGVIHRDIKPDNVKFTKDGVVKLLDFGIAQSVRTDQWDDDDATVSIETAPGVILGTPGYMSPEQIRGEPADERSDIFAFGCLLHEMVTGRPTFARDTIADSMAATLQEDPKAPTMIGARTPADLDPVLMRCLEKQPQDRFHSARDLAFSLRRVLSATDQPHGFSTTASRWPATRIRWPVGTCLAVAIVAIGMWSLRPGRHGSDTIRSLAVLPFVNVSGDPEAEFLCEGIAESIINRMLTVDELRVVPRNTSFRHAGREDALDEIARELGVRAILTGRIIQKGDQLTISVTLEDVEKQEQLWGDRFEKALAGILEVERAIADRIASELKLKLTREQRSQMAASAATNPDAYLAYIEGRFWHLRIDTAALERAIELYDKAIEIDENFALAYVGKAMIYCNRGLGLLAPADEVKPKALAAAEKALEIDSRLAEAHMPLGMIRWLWDWNFEEAESQFREATRIKPDLARAHHMLAHVLACRGRYAEAVAASQEARRLEPSTPLFNSCLGHFYAWDGQHELALKQMQDTVNMDGSFGLARVYLGREFVKQGWPEKGIEQFEYLRDSSMRVGDWKGDLGWAYAEAGRHEEARRELNRLNDRAKSEFIPHIAFARIHSGLRNREETIRHLRLAVEQREAVLPYIANEPHFRWLTDDPEFGGILKAIGLSPRSAENREG